MTERIIGHVEHYYPRVQAAAVHIERGALRVGDQIHIVGPQDDLWEEVVSLEEDHTPIEKAGRGHRVGLWVEAPVHAGAEVRKITSLDAE